MITIILFSINIIIRNIYRVAQKERNGILPVIIVNNDWYQWMVCFLLRKNDAKISHFGQAVLILEHVIPGHVRFKIFTRKLKLCLKTRQKTLTIVNFVNGHCLDQQRMHRIGVRNAH